MLIVADQADARKSLIALCESRGDIQIVGEAACGKAAIDAAGSLNPDIMILDATLPDMSGFDLLRAVAQDVSYVRHGFELRGARGSGLRRRRHRLLGDAGGCTAIRPGNDSRPRPSP